RTRSSSATAARPPTATTSTATATSRSAPARASRRSGAAPGSTSTTTASKGSHRLAATRRLTRAESQERTRTLIVQAATRLFLRDGFGVTSLEQIAEEAGFTRGAVYANYEGKTAIGVAVIDELYAREEQKLEGLLRRAGRDQLLTMLASWADETI